MSIISDPISGVLGAIFKHAVDSKIMQYAKLAFEMAISGYVSYLIVAGAAWAGGAVELVGRGAGMVAAGCMMAATFVRSKNSKGLCVVFPKAAEDEAPPSETENKQ